MVQAEAGWHLLGVFFLKRSVAGPHGVPALSTVFDTFDEASFSNCKDKEFYNFSTKVISYI